MWRFLECIFAWSVMDVIMETVCGGRGGFCSPATHSHDECLDLKGLDLVSPLLLLQD